MSDASENSGAEIIEFNPAEETKIWQSDEELGIRRPSRFSGRLRFYFFAVVAAIAALLGGALIGTVGNFAKIARQEIALAKMQKLSMPDAIESALAELENVASDTPYSRYLLAVGFTLAAESLPAQTALRQRALLESEMAQKNASFGMASGRVNFDKQDNANPAGFLPKILLPTPLTDVSRASLSLLTAALSAQSGNENSAAEILTAENSAIADNPNFSVQRNNQLAYLYATAENPKIFDPSRALTFANRAVAASISADENSTNADWEFCEDAAILDTLAMAYFANENFDLAKKISTRALALCSPQAFDEIFANYQKIRAKFSDEAQ